MLYPKSRVKGKPSWNAEMGLYFDLKIGVKRNASLGNFPPDYLMQFYGMVSL